MPTSLILYITKYGYLAIFSLVFLQEIGVPNPVPNELVLIFSGYLAYAGTLSFPLVFLTAVSADFIGTTVLYFVFYFFGSQLMRKSPKWLPVKKIEKFKTEVTKKGTLSIFLGRLIPYARGYFSVAAGLIEIPPKIFLINVILSAIVWSGGYVVTGRLLGKGWNNITASLGTGQAATILVIVVILVLIFLANRKKKKINHE